VLSKNGIAFSCISVGIRIPFSFKPFISSAEIPRVVNVVNWNKVKMQR
jgi:hypothetical protein